MTGRHAVVTGAGAGIGAALARELGRRGYRLSLVDMNRPALEKIASELPDVDQAIFEFDLSDVARLPELTQQLTRRAPIHTLINNAGIMDVRAVDAFEWPEIEHLLRLDLLAPLRLIHEVLPELRRRGEGCIVNVSSLAGVTPLRGCAVYGAAKAGLALASEALAAEQRGTGIHVVTVYPGPVSTALERDARAQLESTVMSRAAPTGRPEVLARRIAEAMEGHKARVVYPQVYAPARLLPGVAGWLTARFSPQTTSRTHPSP